MQHTEEELRAFIGPKADYYLQAWSGIDPAGGPQPTRWNWPAFFLTAFWLLYRRMYKYFWMFFAVLMVGGILQGLIETALGGTTPPWGNVVINIVFGCFFGSFGNWLYYRHTNWKIGQVKAHHTSPEAIATAGGVSLFWPLLILGGSVVLGILAAIMIPKILQSAH